MPKYTVYATFGTGKSRTDGSPEEYPCLKITCGSGKPWRLSGRVRYDMVCDLIRQAGGDPAKIPVKARTASYRNFEGAGKHLDRGDSGNGKQAVPEENLA